MSCQNNEDCPFLYNCSQKYQCVHDQVFPISLYSAFVYLVIPLACGLVNTTGNSMGIFKVLIVMNMLRYDSIQATMITQALTVGTAFFNYFSILVRKHPLRQTSLVNFDVVYILVPSCLLGSTIGSLIGQFVPILFQDILIFFVFIYFSRNFYTKFQKRRNNYKKNMQQSLLSDTKIQEQSQIITSRKQALLNQEYCCVQKQQQKQNQNHIISVNNPNNQNDQNQKIKLIQYQKSFHIKDILFSFIVFFIFQFFVFLIQGKLPFLKFSQCDWKYYVGIILLILLTLAFILFIKSFLKNKYLEYLKFNIQKDIQLGKEKNFNLIMVGGFIAGVVQGILGLGSCTCIMACLLMTQINATSAAATSGYLVLFLGLASLTIGFVNNEVNLADTAFFIADSFILGGIITLLIRKLLKNKDQQKISLILIFIIFCLCVMSVIMVVASGLETYFSFGIDKMIKIKFLC